MHNRLNRPPSICAKKPATLTRHLQTKITFFMTLLALDYCSFWGNGHGRELWTSFYCPRLAARGALNRLLANAVRTRQQALVQWAPRMTCASLPASVVSLPTPEGHRLAEEASWNTQSKEEHSWHGCVSQSEVIVYVNILVKDCFPLCRCFGKHITTSNAVERNRWLTEPQIPGGELGSKSYSLENKYAQAMFFL